MLRLSVRLGRARMKFNFFSLSLLSCLLLYPSAHSLIASTCDDEVEKLVKIEYESSPSPPSWKKVLFRYTLPATFMLGTALTFFPKTHHSDYFQVQTGPIGESLVSPWDNAWHRLSFSSVANKAEMVQQMDAILDQKVKWPQGVILKRPNVVSIFSLDWQVQRMEELKEDLEAQKRIVEEILKSPIRIQVSPSGDLHEFFVSNTTLSVIEALPNKEKYATDTRLNAPVSIFNTILRFRDTSKPGIAISYDGAHSHFLRLRLLARISNVEDQKGFVRSFSAELRSEVEYLEKLTKNQISSDLLRAEYPATPVFNPFDERGQLNEEIRKGLKGALQFGDKIYPWVSYHAALLLSQPEYNSDEMVGDYWLRTLRWNNKLPRDSVSSSHLSMMFDRPSEIRKYLMRVRATKDSESVLHLKTFVNTYGTSQKSLERRAFIILEAARSLGFQGSTLDELYTWLSHESRP